jgi:hypothetical protein
MKKIVQGGHPVFGFKYVLRVWHMRKGMYER